ncbi:hypothetical protein T492DRAFT_518332, partial [Pavlovales sp. CCMP2436]
PRLLYLSLNIPKKIVYLFKVERYQLRPISSAGVRGPRAPLRAQPAAGPSAGGVRSLAQQPAASGMELDPKFSQPAVVLAEDHGSRLKDAAHLSLQSLGRAIDATDSLVQNVMYQHAHSLGGHAGEYDHLNDKALDTTHTAMKYVTMASSVGDMSLKSARCSTTSSTIQTRCPT